MQKRLRHVFSIQYSYLLSACAFLVLFGLGAISFARLPSAAPAPRQSPPVFAYALTPAGNLYGYKVSETGALVHLPGALLVVGMKRMLVATHPSGKYLYVAQRYDESETPARAATRMNVYRVAADGTLTLAQTVRVDTIAGQILPHPQGKFVYLVCASGDVRVFRLNDAGALTEAGKTKIPGGFTLSDSEDEKQEGLVTLAPSGKYAFIHWATHRVITYPPPDDEHPLAEAHQDDVNNHIYYLQRFRVLPTGAWKADGPVWESFNGDVAVGRKGVGENERNASPKHPGLVVMTPDGKTALTLGWTEKLWAYRVNSSGAWTLYSQTSIPSTEAASSKVSGVSVVDPLGRYVILRGNEVAFKHYLYRLPPTRSGARKPVQTFGNEFETFFAEPTGRFLYALTPDPAKQRGGDNDLKAHAANALAVWKVESGPQFTALPGRAVFPERISNLVFVVPSGKVMGK